LKSQIQPVDALKGNCLFSALFVEKPTTLFLFSNVNKGRKKINKCKEIKSKVNLIASKAIIDIVMKTNKIPSLRIKS
jgi:hypothetical protein